MLEESGFCNKQNESNQDAPHIQLKYFESQLMKSFFQGCTEGSPKAFSSKTAAICSIALQLCFFIVKCQLVYKSLIIFSCFLKQICSFIRISHKISALPWRMVRRRPEPVTALRAPCPRLTRSEDLPSQNHLRFCIAR